MLGGRHNLGMDSLLLALAPRCSRLTSLTLEGPRFSDGGLRACRQLSRLSGLRRLALCGMAGARDYSVHTALPAGVTALQQLTFLDFSRNGARAVHWCGRPASGAACQGVVAGVCSELQSCADAPRPCPRPALLR